MQPFDARTKVFLIDAPNTLSQLSKPDIQTEHFRKRATTGWTWRLADELIYSWRRIEHIRTSQFYSESTDVRSIAPLPSILNKK